jgi:hypothetical protein
VRRPEPKRPGEKPEESKVAEDNPSAIEHPLRLHPPRKRAYTDRQLRPDRHPGGFDKK